MTKKNLKKKGISYFVGSILLFTIIFVNVRIVMARDVSFKSIFKFSYNGEGRENGEGKINWIDAEGNTPEEKCRNSGGIYNTYLKCIDGGIVKVTCEENGKIVLFGKSIYDNKFVNNKIYIIGWELYVCEQSAGNCCIDIQQGLKIKYK